MSAGFGAAGQIFGSLLQYSAAEDATEAQQEMQKKALDTYQRQYQQTRSDLSPYREIGPLALSQLAWLTGVAPNLQQTQAQLAPQYTHLVDPSTVPAGIPQEGMSVYSADQFQPSVDQAGLAAAAQRQFQQQQAAQNAPGSGFGMLTKPFSLQDFQASPAYQFNLEQGQKAINKAAAARGAYYQPGTLQDISRFSQGLASNEYQNAFSNYQTNLGNIWSRLYGLVGTGQNAAAQTGGFGAGAAAGVAGAYGAMGDARAMGAIGQANALSGGINNAYNAYLTQQILARGQQPTTNYGGGTGGGDPYYNQEQAYYASGGGP